MSALIVIGFSSRMWHIYTALFSGGFCVGVFKGPVMSYVAEIAQPSLRGILSATASCFYILGLTLPYILGSFCHWRTLAFISSSVPISAFIFMFWIPESPYWLLMNNKFKAAQSSIAWLRGWTTVEQVQEEYEILRIQCSSVSKFRTNKSSIRKKMKKFLAKSFLWPLSILVFIFAMGQLSGTSTLMIYSIVIFKNLQVPLKQQYLMILTGVSNILGCIAFVCMIQYTGKRRMLFIATSSIGISSAIIGTYAYIKNIHAFSLHPPALQTNEQFDFCNFQWIPLLFILLIQFFSNFGLTPIGIVLLGELFNKETRSTGSGIGGACMHILAFTVNKLFLKAIGLLTIPGIYCFYSSICLIAVVSLYFILPETEGKPLQEIEDHFSKISKLQNNMKNKKEQYICNENLNLVKQFK